MRKNIRFGNYGFEVRAEFERVVKSIRLSETDFKLFNNVNPLRANVFKEGHKNL